MTGDDTIHDRRRPYCIKKTLNRSLAALSLTVWGATRMTINWDGGGVFVKMHGGSRRVGPSNEAVTGRGDEKMDGVD